MFIRKWRERKSRTASPSYSVSSPQCKKKRKSDRGRRSNRSPMNCKTELEPKVPKRSVTQGRISEDLKSFDTRHGTPKAKGNMLITKCKRSRVSQRPEESENNDDTSFALPFSIEFLSLVLPRNTEQARVGKFPPMASESDIFNYEDISIISGQTELAEYRVQETIKSTSNIDQFFTSSPQSVDAFQSPINVDFALESSEDELARFVNACIHSGKLNDAIDIYETVLNHCKNINGKDRLLISSIHNLGIIHTWNRQYDRALFYCTKALKMRRRKYGNHSTEVTSSLCELSIIHYARENFNKALGTLREALQIESLAANRVDNRICSILNNIGCIHFSMGKMNSSLTTLEECLDLQRRLMGKATGKNVDRVLLNMSIVLTNMATVTAKQGDLIDAASLMEQGLIVQQSILPDDHRIISSVKKVLFRLEGNQGDSNVMDLEVQVHQKAVVSEDQTIPNIQDCTDVLSLGLPGTTLNTQQMIQLNLNISGLPQILELEGRSKQHCSWVDIRRQEKLILEEDEFNFFRTCKKAAKLIKADKIDKAIELVQTIRRSHSNKVGDVEFILGALRHVLGLIYLCTEKYQQAIVCFRDSIKMRTDVLDENHVEVLASMMMFAITMIAMENVHGAHKELEKVLRLTRKKFGYSHKKVAAVLNNIGLCHFQLGGLRAASKAFEEAVEILRDVTNMRPQSSHIIENTLMLGICLNNLAYIQCKRDEYAVAIVVLEEKLGLERQLFGNDHDIVKETVRSLANCMSIANCQDNKDKLEKMSKLYVAMLSST